MHENEHKFSVIFDTSAYAIGLTRLPDGTLVDANRAWLDMYGFSSKDEVLGKTYLELGTLRDPEARARLLAEIQELGSVRAREITLFTRTGRPRWISCNLDVVTLGAERYLLSTMHDITDYRRAQEELRRREAYLTESERLSHTGSWAFRVKTKELYWSDEHYRIFGLNPSVTKAAYPQVLQWIHPDDRCVVQQQFEESVRDRRRYELSCRLLRPDGEIRYVQSLAHPVLAECGELIEYVGTTIDVTERRLAEQFLEAQINERKRIESERELLLHRIVVAQEEERRRISWEVHDELGQQLTALLLKLSALKKACGAHPDLAEHVASAEAIARQLDSAVDVLVWSIRPIALDDHGLLAAASNFVTTWSRNAGIRAELHASGMNDVRLARETETVLYRILQEALNNVAKHSKAAHVDVILERRNRHTSLIIEDTGVGFDTAAMPDGDRHFGLVGMRERAALVHGRLLIESKPGHGTTVFARVPSST